ncbi:histone H2A deubiquitinase MYSM1-like isoform X2 [Varroa destructor]|uniref:Myb-like, SWIRM and MPN domain-containing protein 1 n=1 Tax=Varroa destructor TaxID=109461 RepID=A0A7M7MGC8_VARDE|nr:histone H2A deubiquitinase MYSM1-like isoform X2 [Varroa destructor]
MFPPTTKATVKRKQCALSESSAVLQDEFKPLWTSPDVGMSAESQCNEIERILAEDTASSHFGTSFLDSPSPCGQWTRDEEDALARLLRENGKQWNNIAKRLNRTAIEVKAHARKLLLTESFTSPKPDKERPNEQKNRLKLTSAKRPPPAKSVQGHGAITRSGFVRLDSRGRRLRRGNAVTALSFDDEEPSSSKRPMKKALVDAGELVTITKDSEASDEEIRVCDDVSEAFGNSGQSETSTSSSASCSNKPVERLIAVNVESFKKKSTLSDPIQAVACSSTQDNHSSNSAPISELRLDPYRVLPFEEEANAEYFRGKSGQKTPERYLRIRNHIIGLWLKQQPRYLNKTSSRMGLKNCGDVNCIGLIHDYLERIGAINFGCPQTNAKKDRTAPDSTSLKKVSRPRRKINTHQSFVSQTDIERGGCTMEHDSVTGKVIATTLVKPYENAVNEKPASVRHSQATNPFKLIHCLKYDADCQPLNVELCASALLVAESHSHQSLSEVIGLLGGIAEENLVRVMAAVPTRTTRANGTECEMDPVSQYEAAETFRGWGLDVVGWYHSHPTFAPQPSMRDLTLQVDLQNMFNGNAGQPFVALIFSPYYQAGKMVNRLHTKMTCFVVEKHRQTAEYCPFSLKPKVIRGDDGGLGPSLEAVFEMIRDLRGNAQGELVPFQESFNSEWTNLDKMMATLQLCLLKAKYSESETTAILSRIHAMFAAA